MQATILDLRYRMNDVLKALNRNEEVTILYHGKPKGILKATAAEIPATASVCAHPFFNMRPDAGSVDQAMDQLRGGRYRDL